MAVQMIKLTANVLHAELSLLKRLVNLRFNSVSELCCVSINQINAYDLFELAKQCTWITLNLSGSPLLTEIGNTIIKNCDSFEQVSNRLMLTSYIINAAPSWRGRIPFGRNETKFFISKDEVACFSEAGLFDNPPTREIVRWWDDMSNQISGIKNQNLVLVGRRGEECTLKYELLRTSEEPKWMSVESNLLGYDIASIVSPKDITPLLIEVKSSDLDMKSAYFFLSKQEWEVAISSANYCFYLWSFCEKRNKLAIVGCKDVSLFIPTNNSSGQWESVKIPFVEFESFFKIIDLENYNGIC